MDTETTTRQTLEQFAAKHGLAMTYTDDGLAGARWTAEHRRYRCKVRGAGTDMPLSITFHMNPVASGKPGPDLVDVLNCLALDAAAYENAQAYAGAQGALNAFISDFANPEELTRKELAECERQFRGCQKEAAQLRALLGRDAYEDLLWNTESL